MNDALFYCIIQDSKPLIIRTKRPHSCSFYAIFYSHSKPIYRYRPRPGAIIIICLHTIGCHRPVHIVQDVQYTALFGDLVRHCNQKEALLHLYGLFDIALAKALAYCLGIDTFP